MANYTILRRLNCIIQTVKSKPGISKESLIGILFDLYDLKLSSRTLERDFKNIETDFGLEIVYDYSKKGYFLEEDESALAAFFKFAEFSTMAEVFERGIKDYKLFQQWIKPDDSSAFKGADNMRQVVHALSLEHQISFTKENYYTNQSKEYVVSPLFIKEYLNRWYLIAVPTGTTEIRNFGIDRISDIKILNTKALKREKFNEQIKNYNDIVGLNFNESIKPEPELIKLAVTNFQIKYLKSLPLHHSQIAIEDRAGEWGTVTYFLKPNYEFKTQLLRMNINVKVLEPEWFKEEVKKDITKMMNLYK